MYDICSVVRTTDVGLQMYTSMKLIALLRGASRGQLLRGGCEDMGGHVGRGVRRGAGGGRHEGVGGGAAQEAERQAREID